MVLDLVPLTVLYMDENNTENTTTKRKMSSYFVNYLASMPLSAYV